ncbi:MBOAT family O-acyltransferase [Candidatus Latescibacterota bacterium]
MQFNSWLFVVFFVGTLGITAALKRTGFWLHWLLFASYAFYGWLNPLFLILIGYSTVIVYFTGLAVDDGENAVKSDKSPKSRKSRKVWLTVSILNSVFLLGFFKYAGFMTDNLNYILGVIGVAAEIPAPGFILPVGISFYTFIGMSYVIDVYTGKIPSERNFVRLAVFVSFFPYLLAGPIERAKNMLPQLSTPPRITADGIAEGSSLFLVGLFKKVALADFLALYVNRVYENPSDFQGLTLLAATYAFTWQIYFDFSGYTDMARGCARMLGFKLMLNFNNPYLSTGLGEFWQRWHISLSSWFRDYIYIPLGGNRRGRFGTYRNMVLTMLVAGLWHGAAWNFVIWGGLHALGRTVTRELERTRVYRERIPKFVKQLAVFHFVCLTWIFFRAETFGDAVTVLGGILSVVKNAGALQTLQTLQKNPGFPVVAILLILAVWAYQFMYESKLKRILEISFVRIGIAVAMILYLFFFRTSGYEVFYYFRF